MKNKYVFVCSLLLSILIISFGFTNVYVSRQKSVEEEEFVVVTSFYPMYIASMNVIGETDGVALKNLSEPQTGCLHDFQLIPEDMKLLSTADVFIINGGDIESFMEDIAMQYPDLQIIEASEGIDLLSEEAAHGHGEAETHMHEEGESHSHVHGDAHEEEESHSHVHESDGNPHAWMSVELYRRQIKNIADGLTEVKPEYGESFLANAGEYDRKLEELQEEQEALFTLTEGEEVIMLHCAYDYVAEDLGLEAAFCMDLDEERQVSAGEVAEVLEVIAEHNVEYIFAEKLYAAGMCEMIQKETEVHVIYLDPLNRGEYHADSYIEGMRNNLKLIENAFTQ